MASKILGEGQGDKTKIEIPEIDVRDYTKYVLREGKDFEKRELMNCFEGRITLKSKVVELLKS